MAQTTTSVGLRQGKEGTQKLHAPCLPPQRRGFPLTGWRSSDTAPFEQTVAGPRCKRPRVQSMDHPLPPIRWRPQGWLNTPCHQPPNAIRAEAWLITSAAEGCGKAAPMALGPSPVLAQQAVLRISLIHSLPHHHCAQLPSRGGPTAIQRQKPPLASPPRFCSGCQGKSWHSCLSTYTERPPSY